MKKVSFNYRQRNRIIKVNEMKAIEKAKIALRNYLLQNKEQVKEDLKELRKKSKGSYTNWFTSE